MKSRYLLAALVAMAAFSATALAQQRVKLPITNKEWETPFPGFKIVGAIEIDLANFNPRGIFGARGLDWKGQAQRGANHNQSDENDR